MTAVLHADARNVNIIYFLTHAGMPSSSSAPGRLSLRAPCDPAQSRRGKHRKHPGQDLRLPIAEEQQPGQHTDRQTAHADHDGRRQLLAACRAVSQAPGKTPRKLITTAAAESCCWPITPPSVSPAPSADSASSAAHVTASPCSTVRRKPPFQSFDFITAPLLYSLFTSLLQAYVCPGIKRTG